MEIKPHPETGTDALWLAAHIVDEKAIRYAKAGLMTGFSIGGNVNPGGRVVKEIDGRKVTELTDVSFSEISLVDKPANDLATIEHIELAKRAVGIRRVGIPGIGGPATDIWRRARDQNQRRISESHQEFSQKQRDER